MGIDPGVLSDLDAVRSLPAGWDHRRGARIARESLDGALALLGSVPDHGVPAVLPLGSGDVELQWLVHTRTLGVRPQTPWAFWVSADCPTQGVGFAGTLGPLGAAAMVRWVLKGEIPQMRFLQ